jgi:ribosomal protein S12 methylthiotransferase
MKLFVESLGCPKNTVDSEIMIGYIKHFEDVDFVSNIEDADIILINTCGFITPAKEESIDAIVEAIEVKKATGSKLFVAGCLYERYKKELKKELPEVDGFVGVYELENIVEKISKKTFHSDKPYQYRETITPKHIGYLKIAEGCSNGCSFCAIPLIKGGFKSRSIDSLVDETRLLAKKGAKELYLIAQDTTAYMFDKKKTGALCELLDRLEAVNGIEWTRLMYTYPPYITDELISRLAGSNKLLNYIDVPFQHVSDSVLKSMNRKYTKQDAIKLIEKLKKHNITIRSTFIVGYPNETDRDFEELCDFLEEYKLDWAGFFPYYHEEQTQAFKLNDLDDEIKKERLNIVEAIQRDVYLKKHQSLIDKEADIIVDRKSDELPGFFEGRMKRSAYEIDGIVFLESDNLQTGDIVKAKVESIFNQTDLLASLAIKT